MFMKKSKGLGCLISLLIIYFFLSKRYQIRYLKWKLQSKITSPKKPSIQTYTDESGIWPYINMQIAKNLQTYCILWEIGGHVGNKNQINKKIHGLYRKLKVRIFDVKSDKMCTRNIFPRILRAVARTLSSSFLTLFSFSTCNNIIINIRIRIC